MITEWLNEGISVVHCTALVFVRQPLIMFAGLPDAIRGCFHSLAQFLVPTYGTLPLNSLLPLSIKSYLSLCRVVFTLYCNITKYHNNFFRAQDFPSFHLTIQPSMHPSVRPSVRPYVCLPVCCLFRFGYLTQ